MNSYTLIELYNLINLEMIKYLELIKYFYVIRYLLKKMVKLTRLNDTFLMVNPSDF